MHTLILCHCGLCRSIQCAQYHTCAQCVKGDVDDEVTDEDDAAVEDSGQGGEEDANDIGRNLPWGQRRTNDDGH